MHTIVVICLVVLVFLIVPGGMRVLYFALGLIYIPIQLLFVSVQKYIVSVKEKDEVLYKLSLLVVYPLYFIGKLYTKIYDKFTKYMEGKL
jgi:hypothetical protein